MIPNDPGRTPVAQAALAAMLAASVFLAGAALASLGARGAAAGTIVAGVAGTFVFRLLRRRLLEPSERLGGFARDLLQDKDYSRRPPAESDPAAAAVSEAVNELLLQIQFRDVQIDRQREQLDEEVARRTAELTAAMDELRASRDHAEEGARSKAMFLANMSHEIRTPMNGIIGMADLVLESNLSAQQAECVGTIRSSADSLLTIINDVLDFSKIEAGRLELNPEKFRLRESLAAAMNTLALSAEAKGLELVWRVRPGVPDALVGDAGRLRQVLVNLVSNSVKFTECGEVLVEVETESTALGQVFLAFRVRDTGIGIDPQDRPRLFKPFEQADNSATRAFGGTGLGLAIVHQLVQLMGGRTWFESEVGRGSTFHFTLRFGLQRDSVSEASAAAPPSLPSGRVLVVDDNDLARRLISEIVGECGMQPEGASGAGPAMEMLRAARDSAAPYSVALIDAGMPGVDGFALAAQIRLAPGLAGAVVMMLSQTGRLDAAARSQAIGVVAYVPKPVTFPDLRLALRIALGLESPTAQGAAAAHAAAGPARGPLRLLLAEDNPVNRALALRILQPRGHEVTVAEDGLQAVEAARHAVFDVILMDVSMPRMDGLQATQAIRQLEAGSDRRTRIVALTAHALKGDRERCLAAGMDGYVTKPIRAGQLHQVVEQGAAIPVEAPPPAPQRQAAESLEPGEISRDTLLEKFDGNVEAFSEIANVYLENAPRFLSDIESALTARDPETLASAAHSLKGTLTIFSVDSAYRSALRLEKLARGGDLEAAGRSLPPLIGEVRRLDEALRRVLGTPASA